MEAIRVLLVEDDKVDILAFERMMKVQKKKYISTIADSYDKAKKIINTHAFDIAVLDYNLGAYTAFDLFDDLKGTPCIIITGQGREDIAVDAMKQGAYDYIVKDPERNYLNMLPMRIVTALKHKEESDRLKILSHAIMSESDSVCITDTKNNIMYTNDAFTSTYGFTSDEVMGKHICFLWKREDFDDFLVTKKVYKKRSAENWEGEILNWKKDGSSFPVHLTRSVVMDDNGESIAVVEIARDVTERIKADKEREQLINDMKEALSKIRTLSKLLPICSSCKNIRDDKGYWNQIEVYLSKHTDALFTHSICPDCAKKLYPQLNSKIFEDVFSDEKD